MEDYKNELIIREINSLIDFIKDNKNLIIEIETETRDFIFGDNEKMSYISKRDVYLISDQGNKYKYNLNILNELIINDQ